MRYEYIPKGVCSRRITIDMEDGIINDVVFEGGCNGNTQGLSAMVKGLKGSEVVEKLKGINCGFKGTSCPDQLAIAIEEILNKN